MKKLYFRYLATIYAKNCFIFTMAFILFYLFVDVLANYKKLHLNTNIFLLYIVFTLLTAFYYVLPISQILSMIYTKVNLIKKNEIIALYSLGLDKKQLITPIIIISLMFSIIAIALNYTNIAYSEEYKNNILKYGYLSKEQNNLLFKYKNDYVYIDKYDKDKIYGIKILSKKNNEIIKITTANEASFINNEWVLKDIIETNYSLKDNFNDTLVKSNHVLQKVVLNDFNPDILENYSSDSYSLKDAVFYLQNFDSNKNIARASIYKQSIFLLFAPFFIIIIFYNLPIMPRYNDLNIFTLIYTFLSLLLYGVLFLLLRFTQNGAINPELGILLPIVLIILYSLMKFHKNK